MFGRYEIMTRRADLQTQVKMYPCFTMRSTFNVVLKVHVTQQLTAGLASCQNWLVAHICLSNSKNKTEKKPVTQFFATGDFVIS